MKRWLPHPWVSAFVAAAWILLQGSFAPANLLWAAVLGIGLPWLAAAFPGESRPVRVGLAALRLGAVVLKDIVTANIAVARIVLSPRFVPQPAWVRVPVSLQDPRGIALLATIVTNTPGTVSCVVDEDRREILVHALHAPDPQAVADEIAQRYERPLKEIFE